MPEKVYLETEAIFYPDGRLFPASFIWEDQRVKIDKVLGALPIGLPPKHVPIFKLETT